MTCDEAKVLLHALIDDELDAGNARDVEKHVAACQGCASELHQLQKLRQAMKPAALCYPAPAALRARIEGKLPMARAATSRRAVLGGFVAGAGVTALAASGLLLMVMHADDQKRILGEVVSAHLRSLQAQHLIDVQSSDQHTVKPWFNGRLDAAPPVVDLTAQGFTLLGWPVSYARRQAGCSHRLSPPRARHQFVLHAGARVGAAHGGDGKRARLQCAALE